MSCCQPSGSHQHYICVLFLLQEELFTLIGRLLVLAFLFLGHEGLVHTFPVCGMGFPALARQLRFKFQPRYEPQSAHIPGQYHAGMSPRVVLLPFGSIIFTYWSWVLWPSVLWRCWLGDRKGIRPVKTEWWGAGVVICLERGANLYMAQLMTLPLTVSYSCFSKIQIGCTFLVLAHPVSPGQGPLNGFVVVWSWSWVCCVICQLEFRSLISYVCTVWRLVASWSIVPLIWLVLYIFFACLYRMLPHLYFFVHFFLTYLLPYLSFLWE